MVNIFKILLLYFQTERGLLSVRITGRILFADLFENRCAAPESEHTDKGQGEESKAAQQYVIPAEPFKAFTRRRA